jgi:hypothetical protein
MTAVTNPISSNLSSAAPYQIAPASQPRRWSWELILALVFCVLGFVFATVLFSGERNQFELVDEMTHYMVARDVLRENAGVLFDAWGRPGNILAYVFFSESLEMRRFATLVMSFIVVLFATGIAYHIRVRHLYFVPVLLWLQPWFFQYSFQSLTIVPFMLYMTAAVYFWMRRADQNERGQRLPRTGKTHGIRRHLFGNSWRWASLLVGMLPVTRHESLPLLILWIGFLYHNEVLNFIKMLLRIAPPADQPTNYFSFIAPYLSPATRNKSYPLRIMLVLWTFLPYLIWNLGAAALMGRLPAALLATDQTNPIYPNSTLLHYFNPPWDTTGYFPLSEGLGAVILLVIPVALLTAGLRVLVFLRDRITAAHNGAPRWIISLTVLDDRYLWWMPFTVYFLIHVVIISLPNNSLASGGYAYFILPVAVLCAIGGAISISWLLEQLTARTREGANVIALAVIVVVGLLSLSSNIRHALTSADPIRFNVVVEGSELRRTWNNIDHLLTTPPSWMQSDRIVTMSTIMRYEMMNRGYESQLCPLNLWNRPGNLRLYPNLFPEGTVVVFDNQDDSILRIRDQGIENYLNSENWQLLHSWPQPSINWIQGMANFTTGRTLPEQQPWLMAFQRTEANPLPGAEEYAEYFCGDVELRQDVIVMQENVTLYDIENPDACFTAETGKRFPLLAYTYDRTQENAKYFLVVIPAMDAEPSHIAYIPADITGAVVRASYDERLIQSLEIPNFSAVTLSEGAVCQMLRLED